MKRQIYRVLDKEVCEDAEGKAAPLLTYDKHACTKKGKILSTGGLDATLEELVELCDQNAESINAHEFCGCHRLLGAVLFRRYGRESATATMLEIALFGGLQGMNGIGQYGDAYKELKVGKRGHDWGGEYK